MARSQSLAILASAAIPAALAATSGSFTALTFNVAGLPEILQNNDVPGDKTENTATIGQKFAEYDYDIIHVQEDFNYHATLYAADTHPYRTATSGGVPFGSGLNTLSNFDWVDFTRVKWDTCSNASGSDCLTPKGFTFMRVKVDDGVWIDVYNLHTDAGTEDGDEAARTANVQQVADYIDTWSTGNAVLVFGDTNSRYTRTADNIALFTTQNGLTDAWVQIEHAGTPPSTELLCANPSTTDACETVDKLFYRGSSLVSLTATDFQYASTKFLQANGSILSDHNPILIDLAWSVDDVSLRQSDYFGGPHGTWFSDVPSLPSAASPSAATLTLRGANRVDGIAIKLADGSSFTHGGTGGTESSLTLAAGEYVSSVKLCEGQYNDHTRIFYFEATTSAGQTLSTGATTSDCVTRTAPSGFGLVGFAGQDGDEVDQLALVWGKV
ncbi:Mannose-binding lectin [Neofusicoccum parvum]|uniref:Mannose-binding lectin n=2 Tax=Neofusicoccum parvum TaxID=310453 RepID=A0ACB5RSY2_9PEZI|nr:putative endonuclease exonuclease phosphatase family protein [Neofusicoccum parvum UCRNP2]GME23647.1 Mannose-binding lectin [Neofusicoccum parvum]GME56305.1 Mannose-binding lectin [Neofusicoccum parvum]